MADAFDSPIDIAAEVPATALSGLAQMATAVGIAALLLLLFNAHALAGWADGLTPGPRTEAVNRAAQDVHARTQARGFDGPRAALHGQWERVKGLRWTGRWTGQRAADQR
jgi:hypothetical protein